MIAIILSRYHVTVGTLVLFVKLTNLDEHDTTIKDYMHAIYWMNYASTSAVILC